MSSLHLARSQSQINSGTNAIRQFAQVSSIVVFDNVVSLVLGRIASSVDTAKRFQEKPIKEEINS